MYNIISQVVLKCSKNIERSSQLPCLREYELILIIRHEGINYVIFKYVNLIVIVTSLYLIMLYE